MSAGTLRLDAAQHQGRGANNFDLLRLFAAFLVLFAHSFNLLLRGEPILSRAHINVGYGDLGVEIFFATSGFLIARSFLLDSRQFAFWVKRALRIVPALVISVLLTALVIGPLVTTLPIHAYLSDPATKTWIVGNSTFQVQPFLPGVFTHNAFAGTVNGSLWTLPLEIKAYALIAVLGLVAPRRWFRYLLPAAGVYFSLLLIPDTRDALPLGNRVVAAMPNIQATHAATVIAARGQLDVFVRPFACFTIGASLFPLGRWVPLGWPAFAVLLAAWIPAGVLGGLWLPVVVAWTIPYLVLVLAYRTHDHVRLPAAVGDYSYGIYIWAFPIQQLAVYWLHPANGWILLAVSAPVTVALAVASWRFIEAPALTVKARLAPALGAASDGAERDPAARTELDRPMPMDTPIETIVEPPIKVTSTIIES